MRTPRAHRDETRQLRIAGHGAQPLIGSPFEIVAKKRQSLSPAARSALRQCRSTAEQRVAITARAGAASAAAARVAQHALTPQVEQIAGRHDHGESGHQQRNARAAHDMVEIEQPGQETSEQRRSAMAKK